MTVTLEHIREVKATADCLHDAKEVAAAYDKLAREITTVLGDKNPLVISLMNGGLIAAGQILPRLDFVLQIDFIHATRYRNQTVGGATLDWKVLPHQSLKDRHVLLIDDVYTSGATLNECARALKKGGASTVSVLTVARVTKEE